MGFGIGADAFERGDVPVLHSTNLGPAGANRGAPNDHRASAALGETAAEFRARKFKVIAQRIEQRRIALEGDVTLSTVYAQMVGFWHGGSSHARRLNIPCDGGMGQAAAKGPALPVAQR